MTGERRSRIRILGAALLTVVMVTGSSPGSAASTNKTGYERPIARVGLDDVLDGRANIDKGAGASISASGLVVAFQSEVPLTPGDTNQMQDVHVREMKSGKLELASRTPLGISAVGPKFPGYGLSGEPSISANGRFVAFSSFATNLVIGDTNGLADIFVYDRKTKSVERVSLNSRGEEATVVSGASALTSILGVPGSVRPSINSNGRYVSFTSSATNLVSDDTNERPDVFVHDRRMGRTTRVSVDSEGRQSKSCPGEDLDILLLLGCQGAQSSISGNGRFVAFHSDAHDLVESDTNGVTDVFVHDRKTRNTGRVSVTSDGSEAHAPLDHHRRSGLGSTVGLGRALSHDGRYVAFTSISADLVPNDTNRGPVPFQHWAGMDVFVHDRKTGRTERLSIEPDGREVSGLPEETPVVGSVPFRLGGISPDGRYVVSDFFSQPGNSYYRCGSECDKDKAYIFVHDRATGEVDRITSPDSTDEIHWGVGHAPDISRGGRYVSFTHWFSTQSAGIVPDLRCSFCWASFWADRGEKVGTAEFVEKGTSSRASSGPTVFGGEVTPPAGVDARRPGRGATLVKATMALRSHHDDLYVRIEVDRLPGPRGGIGGVPAAGDPALLYGARFSVDGTSFELRSSRTGAFGKPAEAVFGLFRCAPTCTEVTRLTGGYGTAGESVVAAVPLRHLRSAREKHPRIIPHSTYSATGTYVSGPAEFLDQLIFTRRRR